MRIIQLVRSLRWCCLYAFFRAFPSRTSLVAARLGVTRQAIQYQKRKWRAGELRCEKRADCCLEKLRQIEKLKRKRHAALHGRSLLD